MKNQVNLKELAVNGYNLFKEQIEQAPNWLRRLYRPNKYGKDQKRWKLPRSERVRLAKNKR